MGRAAAWALDCVDLGARDVCRTLLLLLLLLPGSSLILVLLGVVVDLPLRRCWAGWLATRCDFPLPLLSVARAKLNKV